MANETVVSLESAHWGKPDGKFKGAMDHRVGPDVLQMLVSSTCSATGPPGVAGGGHS